MQVLQYSAPRRMSGRAESTATALLPRGNGFAINADVSTANVVPEPWCRRRHLLTVFGFLACFCMEVSRNFSVVVIPMAKEFSWDHATVGAIFASSYCEWHHIVTFPRRELHASA